MNLVLLVLQITVVLIVARLVGDLFLKIGQPRVNGEMFAGILLGPSLLGWVWPQASHYLFSPTSIEFLNALGQLGVILFMFLAGLGINPKELASQARATIAASFAGIILLFIATFALVKPLLRRLEEQYIQGAGLGEKPMALVMILTAAVAVCAGYLGLHPLFGAFLVGAAMPKGNRFVSYVSSRLDVITLSVLLPLYLAFSGLRTNVLTLRGTQMWLICGLIIVVGILGKVVASTLAAWAAGMPLREAAGLGSL